MTARVQVDEVTSTTSSGEYVPGYVDPDASDNDVDSDDDFEPIPQKKRGTQKSYSLVKRFETAEAEKELKSEGNKWSKRNRYTLCDGRKQFYACSTNVTKNIFPLSYKSKCIRSIIWNIR